MGKHSAKARGKRRERRPIGANVTPTIATLAVSGAAVAGAALLGMTPTLSASPQLTATLHYLRGTNIGDEPTEQQYRDFIGVVLDGTDVTPPDEPYEKVPYNAGLWPFSHGGFGDLTFDNSVDQGVELLEGQQLADGDMIFGFSQGAVAASQYKETHTGNTYVLVENPSRPNGGILSRGPNGLTIPILGITFGDATPNNGVDGQPGDLTIDVARQYDGWADFPAYLWNPLAVANAVMGIILVHGDTQTELTEADLEAAKASGDSDYYQYDADSNTHYYVIKTYPIPLLMPLDPFLPDPVIAALDAPLRKFIELAYDRTDYGKPTAAKFFPSFKPAQEVDEAPEVEEAEVARAVVPEIAETGAAQDAPRKLGRTIDDEPARDVLDDDSSDSSDEADEQIDEVDQAAADPEDGEESTDESSDQSSHQVTTTGAGDEQAAEDATDGDDDAGDTADSDTGGDAAA